MIGLLQTWWPWIATSLLASVFNLLVAYSHLNRECRYLPFFKPWQSWGFWWWLIVQLAMPAVLFWFLYSLSCKPAAGWGLAGLAISFGVTFTALINAYVDVGFYGFNIKEVYNLFTHLAYELISASQNTRTTEFWQEFQTDLLNNKANLTAALDYLVEYFQNDVSLAPEERKQRCDRIESTRTIASPAEQVKAIKSLMEMRRRDLPAVLKGLGCSSSLIKKYFPKS